MRVLTIIIFIISSFHALCSGGNNIDNLEKFHYQFSGIWDRAFTLDYAGDEFTASWGDAEIHIASYIIIDLFSFYGEKCRHNQIEIENSVYLIDDIHFLKKNSYLVKLSDEEESQQSGYFIFINNNNEFLKIIPVEKIDRNKLPLEIINFLEKENYKKASTLNGIDREVYYLRSGPDRD